MSKINLNISVLNAARQRIKYTFDAFDKVYLSFSGGKDSTVMFHLVADEARRRGVKFGVLIIDLEAQYSDTIKHIENMIKEYSNCIDLYWCALPIVLSNAVSVYEPRWICWDKGKKDIWVRMPDSRSIVDYSYFNFYKYAMEFEEFAPKFGEWYSENGKYRTACFVGIRADESLHRYATVKNENKAMFMGNQWTTKVSCNLYNIYPIYDWATKDVWIYTGKYNRCYNKIYDLMSQAGLSLSQQRLCQPYGADQRKGLWLYQILEPDTWAKVLARVQGANSGAEFVQYSGNISGQIKITKPDGHTWKSFAMFILMSMPRHTAEHYENKISQFISWWRSKGFYFDGNKKVYVGYNDWIPDEVSAELEANRKAPSWRRICKTLLRNDYWCKGLSFSQTNSHSYQKYKEYMKIKRKLRGHLWI